MAPAVATIVLVAVTMVPILAHVVAPVAAISTIVIVEINSEYGFLNLAFGKEHEYPYTYLCLVVYHINLQKFLYMMKI